MKEAHWLKKATFRLSAAQDVHGFHLVKVRFSWQNFGILCTVAFLFVFDKYCLIID